MSTRFPLPIPSGWFAVAGSDELAAGEVRSLRLQEIAENAHDPAPQ